MTCVLVFVVIVLWYLRRRTAFRICTVCYCCAIYNQTRITEQPLRTPSTRKIRIVICSIIKSCSNKSIVVLSHVTYKQGVETHKRTTTTTTSTEYRGNLLSETPLKQAPPPPSTANTAM